MTSPNSLIRSLREQHGLSQILVAEKLGISRASYMAVEAGTRDLTLEEAKRLTLIFPITLSELAGCKAPNYEKYKQMILAYLRANPDSRGKVPKTKLAKLLYLADFAWFYEHAVSMSGMQYRRIQYGPVPDLYFRALDELFEDGAVDIERIDEAQLVSAAGGSLTMKLDLVSREENSLIEKIAIKWRDKRTNEIVNFTHNQLPYQICAENELIPYELIIQEDPDNVC